MIRGPALLAACLLLFCGCGSATTAPQSGIALDQRIGAVSLGEPKARVEAALGPGKGMRLDGYQQRFLFYPQARLYVAYSQRPGEKYAALINTLASSYKTATGVGVGSTEQELKRDVSVFCDVHPRMTTCLHVGGDAPGPVTVFVIDTVTKRVTEISMVRSTSS